MGDTWKITSNISTYDALVQVQREDRFLNCPDVKKCDSVNDGGPKRWGKKLCSNRKTFTNNEVARNKPRFPKMSQALERPVG